MFLWEIIEFDPNTLKKKIVENQTNLTTQMKTFKINTDHKPVWQTTHDEKSPPIKRTFFRKC